MTFPTNNDARAMLECAALLESEYEPTSNGHDAARHIRALLKRMRKLEAELETAADKLSDLWIHLDAIARGEVCHASSKERAMVWAQSLLRHQKAPGWRNESE
jgi:hypothetical protein